MRLADSPYIAAQDLPCLRDLEGLTAYLSACPMSRFQQPLLKKQLLSLDEVVAEAAWLLCSKLVQRWKAGNGLCGCEGVDGGEDYGRGNQ
jgi:hypothetical protein